MSLFKFNAEELKELAKGLAPVLIPMLTTPAPIAAALAVENADLPEGTAINQGKVVYVDHLSKVFDEEEESAIRTLPEGHATYVGRRGTTTINHSAEKLNIIQECRVNRTHYKTRQRQ